MAVFYISVRALGSKSSSASNSSMGLLFAKPTFLVYLLSIFNLLILILNINDY